MNSSPKISYTEEKIGPLGTVKVLDVMEVVFCKYRSIRGHEKKSGSKILFFHEEILISKFGLGIFSAFTKETHYG